MEKGGVLETLERERKNHVYLSVQEREEGGCTMNNWNQFGLFGLDLCVCPLSLSLSLSLTMYLFVSLYPLLLYVWLLCFFSLLNLSTSEN